MKKVFTSLVFSISLFANPNNTFQTLMNESVSILDFGLYKLEKFLDQHATSTMQKDKLKLFSSCSFNWDENKLEIVRTLFLEYKVEDLKKECKLLLNSTKELMNVSNNALLLQNFQHVGYTNKNMKNVKDNEIINRTEVQITIASLGEIIRCKSMLNENDISFLE